MREMVQSLDEWLFSDMDAKKAWIEKVLLNLE
jgi:hypothetical protein